MIWFSSLLHIQVIVCSIFSTVMLFRKTHPEVYTCLLEHWEMEKRNFKWTKNPHNSRKKSTVKSLCNNIANWKATLESLPQISEFRKAQSTCNLVLILWIKSKKDLILRSSNLIACQTGAQANFFFKHDCMNSKNIYHLSSNSAIWK